MPNDALANALSSIATLALGIVGDVAPSLSGASVNTAVVALEKIVPLAISEATDVLPAVRNIIGALKGSGITPEDMQTLAALEVQLDADFDEATKDIPG